ncbi:galactose-3-O-sulfotransferase 2-like [Babylonia areolata]|uniref:galactose-3-O-sulfotransferase 2-like n=1 Tax=Babylonia areolata TaxID=304850 RepID=UPI003FD0CB07
MVMAWFCKAGRRGSVFRQLLLLLLLVYLGGFLYFTISSSMARRDMSRMDYSIIDDIIRGRWRRRLGSVRYVAPTCQAQNNLVFIKCMKCATETLGTIFRRYAYLNNLSVVLPVKNRIYLGWPFPITHMDYRPSSQGFNLLMEHAIYNGTFMKRLMNPGTVFLTMIREPLDLFVSAVNYFNVFQLSNASLQNGMEAVQAYLRNIHHYEVLYKSHAAAPKRYCIPDGFSITKNLLSHCLGMPIGFPPGRANITGDLAAVTQYIKELDSEFQLVMLMEYFEESLVLLKRLMCWSVKDIVHYSTNRGSYRKNTSWSVLTSYDRDLHREWSHADYLLYDHFNQTFWRKVRGQGQDFWQEVAFFREVQRQVTSFCHNVTPYGDSRINFPPSPWSPPFSFTTADCKLLTSPLLPMLKERYEKQEPSISPVSIPREFLPLC